MRPSQKFCHIGLIYSVHFAWVDIRQDISISSKHNQIYVLVFSVWKLADDQISTSTGGAHDNANLLRPGTRSF